MSMAGPRDDVPALEVEVGEEEEEFVEEAPAEDGEEGGAGAEGGGDEDEVGGEGDGDVGGVGVPLGGAAAAPAAGGAAAVVVALGGVPDPGVRLAKMMADEQFHRDNRKRLAKDPLPYAAARPCGVMSWWHLCIGR